MINLEKRVSEIIKIVDEDLKYLKKFYNKNYFSDDLEYLYLLILYYFDIVGNDVFNRLDNLSIVYPNISWLYFYIKGSKAYISKDDIGALVNYNVALNEFRKTNNIERYFMIINNIAYIYNIMGEYLSSYNLTSEVIEYVFSNTENKIRMQNILMHFLFSNLLLKRYKEIIDFINIVIFDFDNLNVVSSVICLIAADKSHSDKLFEKLLTRKIDDHNYLCFIEYFKTRDKSALNDVGNAIYFKKIIDLL